MRVALVVDGEKREIDVDLAQGTARAGDRTFPVRVTAESAGRIELEIAGEKVTVEGWLATVASPTDPVSVNGERHQVEARLTAGAAPAASPRAAASPRPLAESAPAAPGAVLPPMPGRVVELRVRAGDRVTRGQVLLVLEAMKMRNEIPSPSDGVVAELYVAVGANVRAKETMLRIVAG